MSKRRYARVFLLLFDVTVIGLVEPLFVVAFFWSTQASVPTSVADDSAVNVHVLNAVSVLDDIVIDAAKADPHAVKQKHASSTIRRRDTSVHRHGGLHHVGF